MSFATRGGASRRPAVAAALLGLVTAPLALGFSAPAQASVSTKISSFPYTQNWSTLTPTSTWADFPGVEGFNPGTSISASNASNSTDVGTLTAEGTLTSNLVMSTGTTAPNTVSTGGVLAFPNIPDKTVALSATGTITTPLLVFHLDTTGRDSLAVAYDIQDLDSGTDNQPTRVALQYRVGTSGAYTNVPAAYVADATVVSNSTVVSTAVSAVLPAAVDNQSDVYLRVITIDNASGSNEHIGIDNISITEAGPQPLSATDPADLTVDEGAPIPTITLGAAGGTAPYSWEFTGLPAGITETSDGVLEGTPTEAGDSTVTATVTDSTTPSAGTASVEFTITVEGLAPAFTIAEIQGAGGSSTMPGDRVRTTGVVIGSYPGGSGLEGFYLQTPGADTTPGASDGIFVYTASRATPAVGSSVQVTGLVEESFGLTRLVTSRASQLLTVADLGEVVPLDQLPGADCAEGECLTGSALADAREDHESELFLPTAPFTVTDAYDGSVGNSSSMFGEFSLAANSVEPLYVPLERARPGSARAADIAEYNAAHRVALDDGSNTNYSSSTGLGYPWLTPTNTVRAGAAVSFVRPVVFDFRFGLWRLQPEQPIPAGNDGSDWVEFEQDRPAAPDDVLGADGDLKIATFNMLNYFNTTGEQWAGSDGNGVTVAPRRCTFYSDRASNRITNNDCVQDAVDPLTGLDVDLPGPRGAATQVSFERQEDKILAAINTLDADIMSLEEIENSIKLYDPAISPGIPADADRDDAIRRLVQELNAAWLAGHVGETNRWAYVPSPRPEAQPTKTEQDAIRSGFIYDPNTVEAVGRSRILTNAPAMRNAREPLAQAFKPLGGGRADRFGVIVNHFKSKGGPTAPATVNGDNVDTGDGAGSYNGDRKRQAAALVAFADQFAADQGIGPMFLTGDFNAYSMEDPVQVIKDAGYDDLHASNGETSYFFGGLAGSLDHVFANEEAHAMVTGQTVWPINANETVFYEYSRFNSNVTNLYNTSPFRSSDHNPEIVGIEVGDLTPDPDLDVVQVLATNDFHGRLLATEGGPEAGAASLAGAVKQLRVENPDTVFAAAGDLVGGSTFESLIQNDKPTIDALNEAGLEVSAAGNHEFDQGYDDLVNRIMADYDATENPQGGAAWQYIAGNVRLRDTLEPALDETWYSELGDGRTVGFVGAVTEDLPALVAAGGIEEIVVQDIVASVNRDAETLRSAGGCGEVDGCDLVVMLVHEGAASTSYDAVTDGSTFADIVAGASADIDAIVSGHTHLAYNHKVPVQEWLTEGRAVTARPVVSAGQYGAKLNRLEFQFLPGTETLVDIRQTIVNLNDYEADPNTQAIVTSAVNFAAAQGNVPLGDIEGPFQRARRTDPDNGNASVENRGGESTLGNLVAEIQRWKTDAAIGFMNPGGLRADLLGSLTSPRVVNYRQAADVQPFANTLVTMDLTGAQIKTILEQQWQRDADGNIPSRPFLRLGTSDGFTFTYDPNREEGDRITGMQLDGSELDAGESYRVATTSFLASGTGDNFWGFSEATAKQDTGKTDLQAVVDYLAEFAPHAEDVLPVDYRQHAVGVAFAGGAPSAEYEPGDPLVFTLSSLAMTGPGDVQDTQVEVFLDETSLGVFGAIDNTSQTLPFDEAGKLTVNTVIPSGAQDGPAMITVVGLTTGTEVEVPVELSDGLPNTNVFADPLVMTYGQPSSLEVTLDQEAATGTVTLYTDSLVTLATAPVSNGSASIPLSAGILPVGIHGLRLVYSGDGGYSGDEAPVTIVVNKATPTITASPDPAFININTQTSDIHVTVSGTGVSPGGTVTAMVDGNVLDTETLSGGAATLTVGPFTTVGPKTVTITYAGDPTTASGTTTTQVTATEVVVDPEEPVVTTTTATASPMVYGTAGQVQVNVQSTEPTSGSVQLTEGSTVIGSSNVAADGTATIAIAGTALSVGTHGLTVAYLGDTANVPSQGSVTMTVSKAGSATQAAVSPAEVVVRQGRASVSASVSADGYTPTGSVQIRINGEVVATRSLTSGSVFALLAPFESVGPHNVSVVYLGDANTEGSQAGAGTVRVVKATPQMTVTRSPNKVRVNRTEVRLRVAVEADGQVVTGRVRVSFGDRTWSEMLSGERAVIVLPEFRTRGEKTVTVEYLGSALAEEVTKRVTFKVVR
ncbi:ExeM/NucH family extracellular endonuclease [Nocardioides szechwanensis]|uniref:ExeM/NucH family extracellular endonuclease n=1 Tax=Nocardioides szechwanensis TaxID=1005944 RepID=UPI000B891E9D|nr:ExeM/NucH family extracellular endonuclease [Nocardioides szechwanensis]